MVGLLTRIQCERLLLRGMIGRIGCFAAGKVYVVPITYVFEDGYIYAHSREGLKIKMMRKNPNVCFQVDHIESLTNWRSIILWGKFEEIKSSAGQNKAIKILTNHLHYYQTGESVKPPPVEDELPRKAKKPIVYRISVGEISGRYEKQ